jgi:hypothetical protein
MDLRHVLIGVLAISAGVTAIYGLHRLGLWLEGRGWLYYRDRRPRGGARSFVALQEILEPPTRHVFHIEDHQRRYFEAEVPGEGDGPERAEDPASGGDPEPPRE